MVQEVELNFTEQINSNTGEDFFRVELFINSGENYQKIRRRRSVSSVPNTLHNSLRQWQTAFFNSVDTLADFRARRIKKIHNNIEETKKINIYKKNKYKNEEYEETYSSCWQSYQNLKNQLNNWLNNEEGWQVIRGYLETYLNSEEEIRVTIQTDNPILKQLPWQEWDLFSQKYPQAEIALSPSEYEPPPGWKSVRGKPQIRILVILGADDNINLDADQELLNKVREHGAKIETIEQPSIEDLRNKLINQKGWHILFFAGHSETDDAGRGVLYINNDEDGLTIDDIREELRTAIENGLHLAIFNSCDGLGIAEQLAELRLPQSIVMKEPIPNQMAVDFLLHFLDSFSRNEPLFIAVLKARKYLEEHYNKAEEYPGGHLLPVIVPNPAVPLITWKGFLSEDNLPLKYLIPISLVGIVGVLGLPFSLIWEFGLEQAVYYAKLYPHLILYPPIALWAALWIIYKGFCQIINRRKLWRPILGMLAISIFLLCIEITSPNMMLFELSKSAQSTVYNVPTEIIKNIESIPKSIIDTHKMLNGDNITITKANLQEAVENFFKLKSRNEITESQLTGFYQLMELGLDYNRTWKGKKNWVSLSRWFYAFTFFVIVFTVLLFFVFWVQSNDPRQFFNQIKYFEYIAFSQVIALFWLPLRLYYIIKIKNPIFGYTDLVKYLDPFVYFSVVSLLIFTLFKLFTSQQKSKRIKSLIIINITFVIFYFFLGLMQTDLIDNLFGLNNTSEITWILWLVFILLSIYLFFSNADM